MAAKDGIILAKFKAFGGISLVFDGVIDVGAFGAFQLDFDAIIFFCHDGGSLWFGKGRGLVFEADAVVDWACACGVSLP
jgi:hypothetical protein